MAEHLDLTVGSATYFSVTYFVLYNPDHSIYKTITVPQMTGKRAQFISYVTETLFDTDSLIEYMLYYALPSGGPSEVKVINENGNILLDVDSANFTANSGNDPYMGYVDQPIFPNGNQTKLYLYTNNYAVTTVYNLPGQLPCLECANGVTTGLIQQQEPAGGSHKSIAYPNPFTNSVKIKYILPENCRHAFVNIYDITGKLIKKKEIDNAYNELYITGLEIQQGAYFYQVVADDKIISGNKLIKL
jgi:type IX secretion system substrate protein